MRVVLKLFIFACFFVFAAPGALADGLVRDGHVDGPYTLVTLTEAQIKTLDRGRQTIELTPGQQVALQGLQNSTTVKTLAVYPKSTTTCTCEQANVAVRVGRNSIEVADLLLGRDSESEIRDQPLWGKRSLEQQQGQKADWEAAHPSKAALLNKQGVEQMDVTSMRAIEFYKKALQVDPGYRWARRNLAEAYSALGSNAFYGKPNYSEAARYLDLAMKTAEPNDLLFKNSLVKELKIAKAHLSRRVQ